MYVTNALINVVKHFEGSSKKVYVCPAGKRTIGIGHVILPNDRNLLRVTGMPSTAVKELSDQQIIDLKHLDMMTTINQLIALSPDVRNLSVGEVDALASFVFNIGIGNFKTSTLWKYVQHTIAQERQGNTKAAADIAKSAGDQFLRWSLVKGVMFRGLYRRRLVERAIFLNETEIDFKEHGNGLFTNNEQARLQQVLRQYYKDLRQENL